MAVLTNDPCKERVPKYYIGHPHPLTKVQRFDTCYFNDDSIHPERRSGHADFGSFNIILLTYKNYLNRLHEAHT